MWNKLSNLGVDQRMHTSLQKQVILSNRLCVLLGSLLLLFMPMQLYVLHAPFKAYSSAILAFVLACVLAANHYRLNVLGRALMAIATPLSVYIASALTKLAVPAHEPIDFIDYIEPVIFLLSVMGLPAMLFSYRFENAWVIGLYIFYGLLLFGFDPLNVRLGIALDQHQVQFGNHLSLMVSPLLAFASLGGSFMFMKHINQKFEDLLLAKQEALSGAEEELRQNFEELQSVQERIVSQEKQLAAVFDSIPNAIFVTAPSDGTIIMANQKALEVFERAGESLVGTKTGARYVNPESRTEMLERFHKYGRVNGYEIQVYDRDSRPVWISMYVTPVVLNERTFLLTVALDIEDLRRWRDSVLQANKSLSEKNEELQALEEELRQNVEELQAQRDFIEKANNKTEERNRLIERFSKALMALSKNDAVQQGDWDKALEAILSTASQALGTHRVSVWKYSDTAIYCEKLFDQSELLYQKGMVLEAKQYPNYFKALAEERLMVANNAHVHPDTSEFSAGYLQPLQIYSMLDAPIIMNGRLYGVICCEHQYEERHWKVEETTFVKSLTDILAVAHSNHHKQASRSYILSSIDLLFNLARSPLISDGNWPAFLEELTQTAAKFSKFSRVSVWEYHRKAQYDTILCLKMYEADEQRFTEGIELKSSDFAPYFEAIQSNQPLVAGNARTHASTSCFTEVYFKPLSIYSLLDVPYFVAGRLAGVICVEQQHEIRDWSIEDQLFAKSLTDLLTVAYQSAIRVQQQRELSEKNEALEEARTELDSQKTALDREHKNTLNSIEYAQTIQQSLLPSHKRKEHTFPNSFIIYRPKDIVSGDFYWMSGHSNDIRILGVIDCTGHGVPGAFMSIIGHNLLTEIIHQKRIREPHLMLEALHAGIVKALNQGDGGNDDGMDLALCHIQQQGNAFMVSFAGAKNSLFYSTEAGEIEEIRGTRRMIGGMQSRTEKPFELHQLLLPAGTMLYLPTDGFQDQNNHERRRFSSARLRDLMQEAHRLPVQAQASLFEETLTQFMGQEPQRDDVTLIGVRL